MCKLWDFGKAWYKLEVELREEGSSLKLSVAEIDSLCLANLKRLCNSILGSHISFTNDVLISIILRIALLALKTSVKRHFVSTNEHRRRKRETLSGEGKKTLKEFSFLFIFYFLRNPLI